MGETTRIRLSRDLTHWRCYGDRYRALVRVFRGYLAKGEWAMSIYEGGGATVKRVHGWRGVLLAPVAFT
jgi:hypothetical protein